MELELTGWAWVLRKRVEVLYWLHSKRESVVMWIAFRLPRELTYWSVVRVWVDASRKMPMAEVPSIVLKDALDCWQGRQTTYTPYTQVSADALRGANLGLERSPEHPPANVAAE